MRTTTYALAELLNWFKNEEPDTLQGARAMMKDGDPNDLLATLNRAKDAHAAAVACESGSNAYTVKRGALGGYIVVGGGETVSCASSDEAESACRLLNGAYRAGFTANAPIPC